MAAGETLVVVLAIDGDVLEMSLAELLDSSLNVLHAALNAHILGGEVAVHAGTVPVAGDGLGVERDLSTEVFGNAGHQVASDPEIITHCK